MKSDQSIDIQTQPPEHSLRDSCLCLPINSLCSHLIQNGFETLLNAHREQFKCIFLLCPMIVPEINKKYLTAQSYAHDSNAVAASKKGCCFQRGKKLHASLNS